MEHEELKAKVKDFLRGCYKRSKHKVLFIDNYYLTVNGIAFMSGFASETPLGEAWEIIDEIVKELFEEFLSENTIAQDSAE